LCHNPTIRTLFLPGRLHPTEGYVYGNQTLAGIDTYQANWAIVGASGVGGRGACDTDDEAAAIYRAMTLTAEKSIIVADSSKFNQPSLVVYARWQEVDFFLTDKEPPGDLEQAMQTAGVTVEVANGA
jgi:DeoR/GlpR family transcriptional regulator of sugar metabolism